MTPSFCKMTPKMMCAAVIAVHVVLLSLSNYKHSPNIDEVGHLPAGLSHWTMQRFELYAVNPPLVRMVAALGAMTQKPKTDWQRYKFQPSERSELPVGRQFISVNRDIIPSLFLAARTACLIFPIIGMVSLYRFAAMLWGEHAALAACLLWCFSPGMLAFGSTINPDVPAAAVFSLLLAELQSMINADYDKSGVLRVGVSAGLCVAVKTTFLLLLPLVIPFYLLVCLKQDRRRNVCRFIVVVVVPIAVVAWFVLNSCYMWTKFGYCLNDLDLVSASIGTDPDQATHGLRASIGRTLRQCPIPLPADFIQGIDVQKRDFEQGYPSYLMGEWKLGGWWYYYGIALLVKEPIPFLVLLFVSLLERMRSFISGSEQVGSSAFIPAAIAFIVFTLVSSQTGFNHHLRYVFPAYPLLFAIAGRVVILGKCWRRVACCLLAWQAAAVLWFAPHWMSYFNEFAGGPKNGHQWLVNSNIDWGQDILLLKWWQENHQAAAPLNAALYTTFDPKDIGLKYQLPAPFVKLQRDIVSKDGKRGPQSGWYAVSVCMLKGVHSSVPEGDGEWTPSTENFTYFLDNFEPVDMIGYSIYIYHITEADAARVRAKLLAEEAEVLK